MVESFSQTSRADIPSACDVLKARENEGTRRQKRRIKITTSGPKIFFEVLKDIPKN